MTLKNDLHKWTELEATLIVIGKRLGLYAPELALKQIPKYVLWSAAEDNKELNAISLLLQSLVELGAVEERDGQHDLEYRWNAEFNIKWNQDV